jgi:hypothetical protein
VVSAAMPNAVTTATTHVHPAPASAQRYRPDLDTMAVAGAALILLCCHLPR